VFHRDGACVQKYDIADTPPQLHDFAVQPSDQAEHLVRVQEVPF
jgi:hypothetical protein